MEVCLELEELQDLLQPKEAKRKFREHIFEAWHGKCAYCDRRAESLDHIKPKFRGGDDRITNLVPCCHRCNQSKGSENVISWWQRQYFWDQERYDALAFWVKFGFSRGDRSEI